MESAEVYHRAVALTLASVILLNFITSTLATELSEPGNIVLFLDDEQKLQVDYRTLRSLESLPKSHKVNIYGNCIGKDLNNCTEVERDNFIRSFSNTERKECLDFSGNFPEKVSFCLDSKNSKWFGGFINEEWPLNNLDIYTPRALVTDAENSQSVVEYYFFNSHGFYIHFDDSVPLFLSTDNSVTPPTICFIAKGDKPYYRMSTNIPMKFRVCKYNDSRVAHENAVEDFLGKPANTPYDYKSVVENPIWSTWTKFDDSMNASEFERYVDEIKNHSYPYGMLEIDNRMDICYFNSNFYSSTYYKELTTLVKNLNGFNVSLWITPFISVDCANQNVPNKTDYFVSGTDGDIEIWSKKFYYVDFTNPTALKWWKDATMNFIKETGIHSVIFFGGESSWYPKHPTFYNNESAYPDNVDTYLKTMISIDKNTQYTSARNCQNCRQFLRLSNEKIKSELSMLVSSVINSNMLGYRFVIPNMSSNIIPRMYVRWIQAVTFMPAVQISIPPWEKMLEDNEIIGTVKKFMDLRKNYTSIITELMDNSTRTGCPVNPPIWWIDPSFEKAYEVQDEYLLGENILVAPILEEGKNQRDVYLPRGLWKDMSHKNETPKKGPCVYKNYDAPLNILPWFQRISSIRCNQPRNNTDWVDCNDVKH